MTLDQLRIFVAVAERQHVTRAAEALNLVQSAVSTAIANIEGRHATKLFHRVGRGIELTEAGRVFLVEARAVLARAEAAELVLADLSGMRAGRWRSTPARPSRAIGCRATSSPSAAPTLRSPCAWPWATPPTPPTRCAPGRPNSASSRGRWTTRRLRAPPSRGTNSFSWSPQTITSPGRPPSHPKTSPGPIGCCARLDREPARPSRRRSRRLASPRPNSGSRSNCPRTRRCAPPSRPGAGPPSCPRPWSPPRFGPGPWCGRRSSCPSRPFRVLRHKERYRSRAADALLELIATSDPG